MMITKNAPVSFAAIKGKAYVLPRDKHPVEIDIKDRTTTEISGHQGRLYIKEDNKPQAGPYARIILDKVDNKSELILSDKADVTIKNMDKDAWMELRDEAIARVGTIKKACVLALNDSLLLVKKALDGCEITGAHKSETVIDKVKLVDKDIYSKIKINEGSYFRVKRLDNCEVRNFCDGGVGIMSVEPPQVSKK